MIKILDILIRLFGVYAILKSFYILYSLLDITNFLWTFFIGFFLIIYPFTTISFYLRFILFILSLLFPAFLFAYLAKSYIEEDSIFIMIGFFIGLLFSLKFGTSKPISIGMELLEKLSKLDDNIENNTVSKHKTNKINDALLKFKIYRNIAFKINMYLSTIVSNIVGDSRWLKAWNIADKRYILKNSLCNVIYDIYEHNERFPNAVILITNKSVGFASSRVSTEKDILVTLNIFDYFEFEDFYNNYEKFENDKFHNIIDSLVEYIIKKVYNY